MSVCHARVDYFCYVRLGYVGVGQVTIWLLGLIRTCTYNVRLGYITFIDRFVYIGLGQVNQLGLPKDTFINLDLRCQGSRLAWLFEYYYSLAQ